MEAKTYFLLHAIIPKEKLLERILGNKENIKNTQCKKSKFLQCLKIIIFFFSKALKLFATLKYIKPFVKVTFIFTKKGRTKC